MKRYHDYMDDLEVSDTLHQKLTELEPPQKRPAAWRKYGAAAAALVLVAGVGAWGLGRMIESTATVSPEVPAIGNVGPVREEIPAPEIADIPRPDIAFEDPHPGTETYSGYEIVDGEMAHYYVLPYIEYGMAGNRSDMALDWDVPAGSTQRDLTQADLAVLFGSENALSDHLAWGDYDLSGWAVWYEDGSLWGAFINGYKGDQDRFEFAFVTGNHYPPTCIMYGDGVANEAWDVSFTAWGYDGPNGSDRRVELLHDGCGFRFDMTASDPKQAEELVSRLVRWIAVEGLEPDALTSDGAVLAHPWEADPGYSVGEPAYDEDMPDEDGGIFPDCPYCADGTVHTHPYDPSATN